MIFEAFKVAVLARKGKKATPAEAVIICETPSCKAAETPSYVFVENGIPFACASVHTKAQLLANSCTAVAV